jgi:hypothetical protein
VDGIPCTPSTPIKKKNEDTYLMSSPDLNKSLESNTSNNSSNLEEDDFDWDKILVLGKLGSGKSKK